MPGITTLALELKLKTCAKSLDDCLHNNSHVCMSLDGETRSSLLISGTWLSRASILVTYSG